jgi:hypothetical protein
MKSLCHYSRSVGQDLNPGPPEYEEEMLTTQAPRVFEWTLRKRRVAE